MRNHTYLATVAAALVLGGLLAAHSPAAPAPETDEARVQEYVKGLKSQKPLVRKQVAAALGEMGSKAKAAVPALRTALADPDEGVQEAAAEALEKIHSAGKPSGKNANQPRTTKEMQAKLEALRQDAQVQAAKARASEQVAKAEAVRAQQLVADALAKLQAVQKELTQKVAAEKDRAAKAQAEADLLRKRNEALEARVKELEKKLQQRGGNRPPE